jgi:hypothetical protein
LFTLVALLTLVAAWLGWNLLWTHAYNECSERGEGYFAESGDIKGATRAANACRSDAYDNVFLFPKPG